MATRLKVAAMVWFFGMVFAIPTLGVVILALFSSVDWSGGNRFNPIGMIVFYLAPALSGAAVTKILLGVTSRVSNGEIHAGPPVIGCAAGFMSGWIVGLALDHELTLLMLVTVGPLAGAFGGTFVPMAVPPLAAGMAISALSYVSLYLLSSAG